MALTLGDLQDVIDRTYGTRDRERGSRRRSPGWPKRSASWRRRSARGRREQQIEEFADVIAWVATLANQMDVDLDAAIERATPPAAPSATQLPCRC